MSVMAVELGASRLLAPYFSSSKIVWTIVIGTIMIALISVVGKYIILGISALLIFTVSNNFLIIAAFAACMVIFVFPLFLLGTVTPSLVKYYKDIYEEQGISGLLEHL